jgi:hypothetical protein
MSFFSQETGMEVTHDKSSIHTHALSDDLKTQMRTLFPFALVDFDVSLKYLGFHLLPNSYFFKDWLQLVKKIQARIGLWVNRFLYQCG